MGRTYTTKEVLEILRYIRGYTWTNARTMEEVNFMMSKLTFAINSQIREVERDD